MGQLVKSDEMGRSHCKASKEDEEGEEKTAECAKEVVEEIFEQLPPCLADSASRWGGKVEQLSLIAPSINQAQTQASVGSGRVPDIALIKEPQ